MQELALSYLPVVIFMGVAAAIAVILMITPILIAYRSPDPQKMSAYECGFDAFDDARMKFDVRFYLVSILFIIFDLEVAFLFPWAISLGKIGLFAMAGWGGATRQREDITDEGTPAANIAEHLAAPHGGVLPQSFGATSLPTLTSEVAKVASGG